MWIINLSKFPLSWYHNLLFSIITCKWISLIRIKFLSIKNTGNINCIAVSIELLVSDNLNWWNYSFEDEISVTGVSDVSLHLFSKAHNWIILRHASIVELAFGFRSPQQTSAEAIVKPPDQDIMLRCCHKLRPSSHSRKITSFLLSCRTPYTGCQH